MDYSLIAYILLSVVVGGYAVSTLYQRNQTIGAMISLVLLILIFIFFGLRWFQGGSLKGTKTDGKTPWPPIVNACPDFMVSWKDSTGTYCYDAGDLYSLKRAPSGGSIAASLPITNQGNTESALRLTTTSTSTPAPVTLKKDISDNVLRVSPTLRWEGVWDGQRLNSEKIVPS